MPVRYDFPPSLDLFYMAGFGLCTGQEFEEAIAAATRDARHHPKVKILVDMRTVTALSVTPQELDDLMETVRTLDDQKRYDRNPTALLTRGVGAVEQMIGTLYGVRMQGKGPDLRMFVSLEDALAWLGLPEAQDTIEGLHARLMQAA